MPTYRHGRHESGQNFLTHAPTIATITRLVADTSGPIVEIGPGDGALTIPLSRLKRPMTAVEIDAQLAGRLRRRVPDHVSIVTGDFLNHRLPSTPHVVVGNLPFHQTTAMLRRLLYAPAWTDAVLMTQWEVARRRAGVGGSSMMTAQWAPWFEFELHARVPAQCFTPRPGVDGGILTIHRRPRPLLPGSQRRPFQGMVHRVYTGRGRGLPQILSRNTSLGQGREARAWLENHGIPASATPTHLSVEAWVDLFRTTGSSPPGRPARRGKGSER